MNRAHPTRSWLISLSLAFASVFICLPRAQAQGANTPVADEVSGWYEKDRIFVQLSVINNTKRDEIDEYIEKKLGSQRRQVYGERWGNPVGIIIALRIRIFVVDPQATQTPVQLDLSSLKANPPRLTIVPAANGDNWYVASKQAVKDHDPLTIVTVPAALPWAGKVYQTQLTQINVLLQTFKDPRTRIPLWLEFKYTAGQLPGGAPDWKAVNTPAWVVDLSPTADPGNDLPLGNLNPAVQKRPLIIAWTLIAIALLVIFYVGLRRALRYLKRHWAAVGRLDAREQLWQKLRPLLKRCQQEDESGQGYLFSLEDVDLLLTALTDFIRAAMPGINIHAWSIEELDEKRYDYMDGDRWYQVLKPLKAVQQQLCKPLPAAANAALVEQIQTLCPEN